MLCRVYAGRGPLDARGVADWLEKNGVRAFVKGDGVWTPGDWSWPSVWVLEGDEDAARALIVDHGDVLTRPDVLCGRCGEPALPGTGLCGVCTP